MALLVSSLSLLARSFQTAGAVVVSTTTTTTLTTKKTMA